MMNVIAAQVPAVVWPFDQIESSAFEQNIFRRYGP